MSSNGWKEYKFSEILSTPLKNGVNKPTKVRGDGYKMVNMGELFANPIIRNMDMARVPMTDSELKNSLLQPEDLLFARQSLTIEGAGKCSLFIGDDEPYTFEGHLIRARVNREIAIPRYIYYYFNSFVGKSKIETLVHVTAAAGIRSSDLSNLKIELPPLPTQRRIADILSTLDEKIELNRQTNATLESIAKSIYREWLVEFNISDEKPVMVNSELGMIPIGWKIGKLGDVCLLTKGVSYRSDELQPSDTALVTLKSINRGGGFNFDGFKEYTGRFKPSQLLNEGDLVFAQTDITQNADIVGSPAIVENPYDYNNLVASLDIVCCKPINEMPSSEALYYFLKHQDFKEYCLSHTNGSTVLHLRTAEVPNYPLVIPDEKILKKFDAIVSPIRQEIICNNRQSQLLSSIRDSLLPKLISGKIDVDNVVVNTEKK